MRIGHAYPRQIDSLVIVKNAGDLMVPLRSDVIYLIDGNIDVADNQILVPQTGLFLGGLENVITKLFSSVAGHTMFIDDGVFAGDLTITDMDLSVTGAGSQLFDLDNDGNQNFISFENVNFVDCVSAGTLRAYRQGFISRMGVLSCLDGITFAGVWDEGFLSTDMSIVPLGTPFTGTMFKAGTGLTFGGSFRSTMLALGIDNTGEICDFAPANILRDGGFFMDGVRVNQAATPFPNFPQSNVKAQFRDCQGIRNTYPGSVIQITTAATTTITTQDVLVQMAGVGVPAIELSWFSASGSNSVIYNSDLKISVAMNGALNFSGASNSQMTLQCRQFINATSSYAEIGPEYKITMNSGGRVENMSFEAFTDIAKSDRLEVWVMNTTGTQNITTEAGGQIAVRER